MPTEVQDPGAFPEVSPEDAPPSQRLGYEPEIGSLDDLAVAVHEISYLESRQQTERANLDQAIRLLKADAEARQQLKVGRHRTTLTARQAALAAAVTAYVEAHPEVITETGKKTRKFTHGDISLRATKLSVVPHEGFDWDQVLDSVRELGYRRFVRTKYSLDKQRLISDLADEKLTDAELETLHLDRQDPHDEVRIKPGQYSPLEPAAL